MTGTLKSSYYAGKRAGLTEPPIHNHMLVFPSCPFTWHNPVRLFLWHEGYYRGTMKRLDTIVTKTVTQLS